MTTWPKQILDFLESNFDKCVDWECKSQNLYGYESVCYDLKKLLAPYSIIGYHCTKLTSNEIKDIRLNGMRLQNSGTLNQRIDLLKESGVLNNSISDILKNNNQADDFNRSEILWFCFFEPFIAGSAGIERFFRSWGGEALYNSHERNPITGPILNKIGIPCVIKANVPITYLDEMRYPDEAMIRVFLSNRSYKLQNSFYHEGYIIKDIKKNCIIDIIEYPSDQFFELTKCETFHN